MLSVCSRTFRENGMKAKSILKMNGDQTILSNPKNELDVKTFT